MKHGSIPVVNPNDAKLPPKFYNNSAPIMHLQFLSDKKPHYVNLTSPRTGYYYATAFLPYSNPQSEAITQAGKLDNIICSTLSNPRSAISIETVA